jgi:predicted kinase
VEHQGDRSESPAEIVPRTLVLVAGGAASGKSRLARELVRQLPNAVLLDKDRLLGPWVDRILLATGVGVDRDSPYYLNEVRPREYETIETIAFDHLQLGKVVVIDAPLAPELRDPDWVARIRAECRTRGAGLVAVWVAVSPETARRRLQARGEARDRWKLEHWEEFLATRRPYDPPAHVSLVLENEEGESLPRSIGHLLELIQSCGKSRRPT